MTASQRQSRRRDAHCLKPESPRMQDPGAINKPATAKTGRRANPAAGLMAKRLFDISASATGLVLLLPLLLLIALALKMESRGPVFFRQDRVGRYGQTFRIHKFRTMVADAERPTDRPIIQTRDERVTRLGHFLRRHKLDELPQLIDVLRGKMSLVGPRPQVPAQMELYHPTFRERLLAVRPGITGPATLEFKHEHQTLRQYEDAERAYIEKIMPAKLAYNIEYLSQQSFWGDIKIILATLKAVFFDRQ